MEGGVHRGRWNKKAPVGTILLLMCMFTVTLTLVQHPEELSQPTEEPNCQEGDFLTEEGICCNKCNPGSKLVESCRAPGQRSKCKPCPDNQYADKVNYAPNCKACRKCKFKHEEQVSPCTKDQDAVCRCVEGFFKSFIDSSTYQCLKCAKCKPDEQAKSTCTPEKDTVCECKETFYRVNKKCVPCKNCSEECGHLCTDKSTKGPNIEKDGLINIIGGVVGVSLVMLVLVAIVTYMVTKWLTKKKLLKSSFQPSDESTDSCEQGLISEGPSYINSDKAVPNSLVSEQEQLSNLPDCVPSGVNYPSPFPPSIPALIYMVLDLVPVPQMKQLVRSLGVRDTEIEQAERDHRSCREAHYQMLKVWAERGSRAGGMQQLLDELKKMHLEWAAEELETKYGIQ